MKLRRVLFLQYANAAAYPPVLHASAILAGAGWDVRIRSVRSADTVAMTFPMNGQIESVETFQPEPGWRQKLHYARYAVSAAGDVLFWKPLCIYGSDFSVAPILWLISLLSDVAIIYHEHDTPAASQPTLFGRACMWARRRVARNAKAVVLPNRERASMVKAELQIPMPLVVWNCPSRSEAVSSASFAHDGVKLLYHGSINSSRFPMTLIGALALTPDTVSTTLVGYETILSRGYVDDLRDEAARLGVAGRLCILPPVSRADLPAVREGHDIGIAVVTGNADDLNLQHLAGASCKVFEYMSSGMVPLVPATTDWMEDFIQPEYAVGCDPDDAESIAAAITEILGDSEKRRRMGERARERIARDWNYETQFAPVLAVMSGLTAGRSDA
jgi:glycosyltransferase involved in cell wall biosynthesis